MRILRLSRLCDVEEYANIGPIKIVGLQPWFWRKRVCDCLGGFGLRPATPSERRGNNCRSDSGGLNAKRGPMAAF